MWVMDELVRQVKKMYVYICVVFTVLYFLVLSLLSTHHYPFTTIHYPLATQHYPLGTSHSALSTQHYPLTTSHSATIHSVIATQQLVLITHPRQCMPDPRHT